MQDSFILGMEARSSFIFGSIWIGVSDLCVYGHVGDGLNHYGDEIYFQSLCGK